MEVLTTTLANPIYRSVLFVAILDYVIQILGFGIAASLRTEKV